VAVVSGSRSTVDVRRGVWRPPARRPELRSSRIRRSTGSRASGSTPIEANGRPNTVLDYEWQLRNHLLPFFAGHGLSQVTIAELDRYRQTKVDEASLSAESINKTITRLGRILAGAMAKRQCREADFPQASAWDEQRAPAPGIRSLPRLPSA